VRLFIALHLAPSTRAEIESIQDGLRAADHARQVRWVDPGGIHLTLQFLGEVPEDRAPALEHALGHAVSAHRACRLGLAGAGAFPNLRRARVLWLGLVEEGDALQALHRAVESATEPLGWQPERRPFQPHLTLGRVREGQGGRPLELRSELQHAVERVVPPGSEPRLHDRVALIRSHLSSAGARYEDLHSWRLAE